MFSGLLQLIRNIFRRPHTHKWIQVGEFVRKDTVYYAHEKYYCKNCDYQMHVIRRWNKKPKSKITKIK